MSLVGLRALVYSYTFYAGSGKGAMHYANALASGGCEVLLVAGRKDSEELRAMLKPSIRYESLKCRSNRASVWPLARILKAWNPNFVLAIGGGNLLPVITALRLSGIDSTVVLREANSPSALMNSYRATRRVLRKLTYRECLKRTQHVIALTHAMAVELKEEWGVPADRLSVIYNGVDLTQHSQSLGHRNTVPVILSVARLTRQKDIPTLLRAFALTIVNTKCELWLVGNGPLRSELEWLASELGIAEHVKFFGSVPPSKVPYALASVCVLSSHYEGFPNCLIEALASGVPVVSTDCPTGPAEIISSQDIGYLVNPRDPNDLASKLYLVLNSQFDKDVLSKRAQDFSLETMNSRVRQLFVKLPES